LATEQGGILYLVATPIGNLGDITLRAIETLKQVDFLICEDTRRSGMLLKHLGIQKKLKVLNEHTHLEKQKAIVEELANGSSGALISDAGTPLISDPGFQLVREAIQSGIKIEAIPGPSAFVSALILSALPSHRFTFTGYLPQKEKARRDALAELTQTSHTLIFYESPYRLLKTLKAMIEVWGDRKASVSRELTKKFEETVRGTLHEISDYFQAKKVLGEYVIVVEGSKE
jgi:16S rRNA (cytidine1402-2'-O)-methyltransferase